MSSLATNAQSPHTVSPPSCLSQITNFKPATTEEVRKIICNSPNKQCSLNPIPTSLFKNLCHILAPVITKIITHSMNLGYFPDSLKIAVVTPLLKKPTLDKEILNNYWPISNLSFLSKILEKIVKLRLTNYLSDNDLFNQHQSAYTHHHSTETVLLSVHDHIIR